MTLTLQRPLINFDLETTGIDVNEDRVIEIAVVKLLPNGEREARCKRINPGIPIPPAATEIHGITDADVAGCPTFAQVGRALFEYFDGCDVGGYNITRFDIPILAAEFRRLEVRWPAADVSIVDAFAVYRMQEDLYSLAKAVGHYTGRSLVDAHRADVDVQAAVDVLEAQAERYGATTIAELAMLGRDPSWVDSQGKLRREGDRVVLSFGDHSGKPLDSVPSRYLGWMTGPKANFPADTVALVRAELERRRQEPKETDADRRLDFDTRPGLTPEARRESCDPQSGRGL